MNELQVFNNPDFGEMRTLEENGAVLFCGKDVAEALGYKDATNAMKQHCRGVVKRHLTDNLGREQSINFIPESDLYRLVFSSKLPKAEEFTDWVTSEVLPSIRRNGGYISGQETMTPEELMAAALLMADKTIKERDAKISALTVENQVLLPKAQYFDQIVDRNLLTNFRETAKELGIKQTAFVGFLLDHKYVYRDKRGKLMPYAAHSDNGLFEIKEQVNDKTGWSGTQTLITPKGRETFRLLCQGL